MNVPPRQPAKETKERDSGPDLLNQCLKCEYSLEGHPAKGSCPECGHPFDKTVGIWRNGEELVYLKRVKLPRKCFKCGTSEQVMVYSKHLRKFTIRDAVIFTFLLCLFPIGAPFALLFFLKSPKVAFVDIAVCGFHHRQHILRGLLLTAVLLIGVLVFTAGVFGFLVKQFWVSFLIAGFAFLLCLAAFVITSPHVILAKATYVDKNQVRIKGCCEKYLSQFPEWVKTEQEPDGQKNEIAIE